MKSILMSAALGILTLSSQAATLSTVGASATAVQCIFNPACTNAAQESVSPITLQGTTGSGFLQTRVVRAETNSAGAGLFGYEYRLDLSGVITATNHPACLTNVVRCRTNSIVLYTNRVACYTNIVGVTKAVTCFTNTIPATNLVVCVTNAIRGTNIHRCFTNAAGATVCITNIFPATNVFFCITNRIPARTFIACRTNIIDPGHPVVKCVTNRVSYRGAEFTCRTNLEVCPGAPPCVKSLRIQFGDVAPFDFNHDGTNDDAYVVTTGGSGTVHPASVKRHGRNLVIRFSPPLCAGESSLAVGVLSTRPPGDVDARIALTSGSLKAGARGPGGRSMADCDFERLAEELRNLRTRDFIGATDAARETRRAELLGYQHAALLAAQANNVDGVLNALAQIIVRADGGTNDWLSHDAAEKLNDRLKDLLECLEDASGRDLDGDDDRDEMEQNDDDDDKD